MPNIKSAKKRVQVTERNRLRNVAYRSAVKTAIKKALVSIQAGVATEIQAALSKVSSILDRTVSKGVLHKNKAARLKSRLAKRAHKAASTVA
ncbi:MAG: 30S ribosomal protein S20 [Candidatus Melainabacteria bacterium]|nr:30S ribosomal protein S20 [Candidatus Melainabacteria bacterium]